MFWMRKARADKAVLFNSPIQVYTPPTGELGLRGAQPCRI